MSEFGSVHSVRKSIQEQPQTGGPKEYTPKNKMASHCSTTDLKSAVKSHGTTPAKTSRSVSFGEPLELYCPKKAVESLKRDARIRRSAIYKNKTAAEFYRSTIREKKCRAQKPLNYYWADFARVMIQEWQFAGNCSKKRSHESLVQRQ
jgi:hypothetical protein